jgi:hypothetical protein
LIIASLAAFTLVAPDAAQSNKVRLGYQCSLWGAPAMDALDWSKVLIADFLPK